MASWAVVVSQEDWTSHLKDLRFNLTVGRLFLFFFPLKGSRVYGKLGNNQGNTWAVVVAQLAEWFQLTPEIRKFEPHHGENLI